MVTFNIITLKNYNNKKMKDTPYKTKEACYITYHLSPDQSRGAVDVCILKTVSSDASDLVVCEVKMANHR